MIFELAVKSESIYKSDYFLSFFSYKYKQMTTERAFQEVDLLMYGNSKRNGLLLESTVSHKKSTEHSVNKVLPDHNLIRVLTDEPGIFKDEGDFYRIGYPKALLMLSNGTIYDLEPKRCPVG
jgi:hypothetical protein